MKLYKKKYKNWLRYISLLIFALKACTLQSQHEFITPEPLGQLPSVLSESSGLALTAPNRLWTHNDSGNTNELFCIDTTATILRTITVFNALNIDWEDLAMDDTGSIFINDAGNNNNDRDDLRIYIIPNPDDVVGDFVEAEIIEFVLEDQTAFPPPAGNRNFDIEATVWKNGHLYLFTKNRSNPQNGWCKMYRLPAQAGSYTAALIDSVYLGSTNQEARVTAADYNIATGQLLLLTRNKIVSFTDFPDDRFFEGKSVSYYFSPPQGQIEALVFADSHTLYMTEEGSSSNPGFLYRIELPVINSIESIFDETELAVYPNPALSEIQIKTNIKHPKTVEILSPEGRIVKRSVFEPVINIADLPAGKYILRLGNGRFLVTRPFIKL